MGIESELERQKRKTSARVWLASTSTTTATASSIWGSLQCSGWMDLNASANASSKGAVRQGPGDDCVHQLSSHRHNHRHHRNWSSSLDCCRVLLFCRGVWSPLLHLCAHPLMHGQSAGCDSQMSKLQLCYGTLQGKNWLKIVN